MRQRSTIRRAASSTISRTTARVYDRTSRHLVSSSRFVFNYAMAYRQFGDPQYLEYARHGLRFLRDATGTPSSAGTTGRSSGVTGEKRTIDGTRHCYGLAFVLLAHAPCGDGGHRGSTAADRRDVRTDGAPFLGRRQPASMPTKRRPTGTSRAIVGRTPTCTRPRRCSRPTRQPDTSSIWTAPSAWPRTSPSARRSSRTDSSGSTSMPIGRSIGITTRKTARTSSVPGASSPGIRPSGPSCC